MKDFYSHLIDLDDLIGELDSLSLEKSHKKDLCLLIDSMIHNLVLDHSLSKLDAKDKEEFLKLVQKDLESEVLLNFLKEKIDNFEDSLKFELDNLKKELIKDIQEAKDITTKY